MVQSSKPATNGMQAAAVDAVNPNATDHPVEKSSAQAVDAMLDRLQDSDAHSNSHAFVIMPFGIKTGPDGKVINFDTIDLKLIKPALCEAGFDPFRADEETISGDILTDMFQELLLADLVVVDMSIDNANAFYELGITSRMAAHAM